MIDRGLWYSRNLIGQSLIRSKYPICSRISPCLQGNTRTIRRLTLKENVQHDKMLTPSLLHNDHIFRSTNTKSSLNRAFLLFPMLSLLFSGYFYYESLLEQDEIEERQKRMNMPPIELPLVLNDKLHKELLYRIVYANGQLLHEREMHVLPRKYENQMGLHIYTPLRREDESCIIINRGWVPTRLQHPDTRFQSQVNGLVTTVGHLVPEDTPLLPIYLGSNGKALLDIGNSPEKNIWRSVKLNEMAKWAQSKPILISTLMLPPNPGGLPIGGQTDFKLKNVSLESAYHCLISSCLMSIFLTINYYRRKGTISIPWRRKPPAHTPFTL